MTSAKHPGERAAFALALPMFALLACGSVEPSDRKCADASVCTGTDGGRDADAHAGFVCHTNKECPTGKGICADGGVCVGCTSDSDCTTRTSPICNPTTNTCVPCTTDAQCVAKFAGTPNPGVCMFQDDGHCAVDAETVYVENTNGCLSSPTAGGGTADAPFCFLGPAVPSMDVRDLIVVRGTIAGSTSIETGAVAIVGQQSAKITPATAMPGIEVSAASVYIRGIRITGGDDVGISVGTGATLTLDTVQVDACAGGGVLLNGAAFDIKNTTVTGNGPGLFGGGNWGGILIGMAVDGGASSLDHVSIENNLWTGLACAGQISGTAVLASGNMGGDITPACGITACTGAGPNCGAP